MKAPNKIYVLLDERTGFLSHTFTNVPCGYESSQDIEYIRKDALLEWLKEKEEWYEGTPLATPYQRVIDKLNEM